MPYCIVNRIPGKRDIWGDNVSDEVLRGQTQGIQLQNILLHGSKTPL